MADQSLKRGRRKPGLDAGHASIVERLAAEAIRLGSNLLEVEYKDRHERVFARCGALGYGIARLRSSSPEAKALREGLYDLARRKRRIEVDGFEYDLLGKIFESFGEDVFRIEIRPV